MATKVETLETVTEIGESGSINFTMLGESQPMIAPMHKLIIEPKFRINAPRAIVTRSSEGSPAAAIISGNNNYRRSGDSNDCFARKLERKSFLQLKAVRYSHVFEPSSVAYFPFSASAFISAELHQNPPQKPARFCDLTVLEQNVTREHSGIKTIFL